MYDADQFVPPWFLGEEGLEALYSAESYTVLDFETTNIQKGTHTNPDNTIVLSGWTVVENGRRTKKHYFGNEYELKELVNDIERTKVLVAYNAQFELGWLRRCGLDLRDVLVYDPMVAEWVIAGNRNQQYSMEAVAKKYKLGAKTDLVASMIKMGICPSLIPRSWLLRYCRMDVDLAEAIYLRQREELNRLDLWHIILARMVVIPVLTDMQANGLEIDADMVAAEEQSQQKVIKRLGMELDEITGGINLGSPKQLGKFLYETMGFKKVRDPKTGEESNSVAAPILAQLKSATPEQEKFLELYDKYNFASTMLSKSLNYMLKVTKFMGSRFFGAILQCRTKTHRMAGGGITITFPGDKKESSFQLQNIPRVYKKFFTAHDPDYEVLEIDGAGMEFRVAGLLGRDEQAASDIINGEDIHAFTRDTMNAAYLKHAIKIELTRQEAKSSTFTPLYFGMGKDAAEKEYAEAFAKKYHGIRAEQNLWINKVAANKQLTTPYGMVFYWPDAKMLRNGWVTRTNEIVNLPIQGLATAEMIPISLVHFWHRTKGMRVELFNTVHDSLVARVHKDDMDMVKQAGKIAMTTDVYNFMSEVYRYEVWEGIPLGAGMKHGTHWGESNREEVYEVWRNGDERVTVEEPDPLTGKKTKRVILDTR